MGVDGASNNAIDQANHTADDDGMPNTADMTDANGFEISTDDQANYTVGGDAGDGAPDVTNMMDANVFEIITQSYTSRALNSDLTVPNPEQIPLAEVELPPETLPNPLEQRSTDARPLVTEQFPCGNPGAPINGMQGYSIYESSQDTLGGSVWALFQSERDWHLAHWAKMHKVSSSVLSDLFAIPNVRPLPFFFFVPVLLNVV